MFEHPFLGVFLFQQSYLYAILLLILRQKVDSAMTTFVIFVNTAPLNSINGRHAIKFCQAAMAAGHQIQQIFFYGDGVNHANCHALPVSGETPTLAQWIDIKRISGAPLNLCITAAEKRGLVSAGNHHESVSEAFSVCGMADYFSALHQNEPTLVSIQF